jgi:hypothetical protein
MHTVPAPRTQAEVDEIVAMIRKQSKKIAHSKKSARSFLVKFGYITKNGKLTEQYQ